MEPKRDLPNPKVCRTRQLYDTGYYLCLVDAPIGCPQLSVVSEFHICNHHSSAYFTEENNSRVSEATINPSECEHQNSCVLIQNMSKNVPFTVKMIKEKYCEFNKDECARYKLLLVRGVDGIPYDLWPCEEMKAFELFESELNEIHKPG